MPEARIVVRLTVDESDSDPSHETGLTGRAYDRLYAALERFGWDIEVEPDV